MMPAARDVTCPRCGATPEVRCSNSLVRVLGAEKLTRAHKERVARARHIGRIHTLVEALGVDPTSDPWPDRAELEFLEETADAHMRAQACEALSLIDHTGYDGALWSVEKAEEP